ncbi:MAG TPA: arginase family protein [Gemmatimonadaceae bacterium]|nr:arginase family protein [Gemmatimonadaceae bacterium]
MKTRLIVVPYDSAHEETRMGRGPGALLQGGLVDGLRAAGHEVAVWRVEAPGEFRTEVGSAFALARLIAAQVRAASEAGELPLVLAGNCNSCLGTLAGLGASPPTGVLWLDAHGDFNTPDTTASGFFDGMALATATGRCWPAMTATIDGWSPVPDAHVVHAGARDLDDAERELLADSGVAMVEAGKLAREGVSAALGPCLDALARRVRRVYLHVDLDVLDPDDAGRANGYAPAGGLAVDEAETLVSYVGRRFTIAAAALTAYDPACDPDERVVDSVHRIARALLGPAR